MHNFRSQNLKFKHFIDNITINFWSFWIFASLKEIQRKYNLKVDLSKFTYNTKILSWVIVWVYKTIIKFVVKLCPKFVSTLNLLCCEVTLVKKFDFKKKKTINKEKIN